MQYSATNSAAAIHTQVAGDIKAHTLTNSRYALGNTTQITPQSLLLTAIALTVKSNLLPKTHDTGKANSWTPHA